MLPQTHPPHPLWRNSNNPRDSTTPGFQIFGNLQRQDDIDGVEHLRARLVEAECQDKAGNATRRYFSTTGKVSEVKYLSAFCSHPIISEFTNIHTLPVAGCVERLVEMGDMEKGFATPLHKPSECISPSSAKGFQTPSPYMDALHHAGVDEVFEEGGGPGAGSGFGFGQREAGEPALARRVHGAVPSTMAISFGVRP
jgi:hypothetical protein